ncbi:MAG TPA: histidine phosphatase family protein [Polyangiaceae bacterium]|nr:histidine phosphatase family protein [Polyangiaceae bacterium]
MKTLLVLRHAKANRESDSAADHDRTLAKRGVKAAERIGALLRDEKLLPELVLSSTAARARSTAELVAREAGVTDKLVSFLPQLYLAEPPAYIEALRKLPREAERVLVVGHNPGIETLVYRLTGETEHMPTAALAVCELPIDDWSELSGATSGHLARVVRPKGLDE